ncbi:protease [Suicoccus acidiformans]|uniref:Protease n=1 Tax=Suicoccus acidiformans TaxID=2036206 RepID=A0A347WK42_9LACT|nr:type 1 glutamine amidotransferase domain-containing protein [Suicoccus acidiformans]AXY25449.1 protease [Suicoccus acidiformans]
MTKVATVITDLFEDVEYTSPREALEEAGHEVVTIGIEAGQVVKGKTEGVEVEIDQAVKDADAADFDALLIPGGYSPDKLRADEDMLAFVREFAYEEKPIFSICHAPQLLVNADVLRGKRVTAVKQVAVDVINAGGLFFDKEVVTDPSGLVSSRTPEDIPAFNEAIIKALEQ